MRKGETMSEEQKEIRRQKMTGRQFTSEHKKALSDAKKRNWADDEYRKAMNEIRQVSFDKPEHHRLLSENSKKLWRKEGFAFRRNESHKQTLQDNPNIVGKMTEGWRNLRNNPEKYAEAEKKRIASCRTQEFREKHRAIKKKAYEDLDYKNRVVEASAKSPKRFPNKPESKLLLILENLFPNEWEYTGGGKYARTIGSRTPDFTHTGKKKLIELYGRYWHSVKQNDCVEDRVNYFREFGYDTLVIWDDEEESQTISKLMQFSRV